MAELALESSATVNSIKCRWTLRIGALEVGSHRRLSCRSSVKPVAASRGGRGPPPPPEGRPEIGEVQAIVGDDGTLQAAGEFSFHFLHTGFDYMLSVEVSETIVNSGTVQVLREAGQRVELQRCPPTIAESMWQRLAEIHRTYVGPEHDLGEWLSKCPEDIVWIWQPGQPDLQMLQQMWLNACFTLCSPRSPIVQCPNPMLRHCLDLQRSQHWLHGKKVKRHKEDFRVTVNQNFCGTFDECRRLHEGMKRGVWITPELVEALDASRRQGGDLKVYSVELWEKSTGKLAAAIMSFSVGDIFHDYSTACFIRDSRSPGALLTKVTGYLLQRSGYTLWYWGFKNPYMAEYDSKYGATPLDNQKFWQRWKSARALCGPGAPDLASCVPAAGLDLATL